MAKAERRRFLDCVREFVCDKIAATAEEIEAEVEAKHGSEFDEDDREKIGSGRLKWKNDVDWARAHLTSRRETLTVKGVVLWLPLLGQVDNKGLCAYLDAISAVQALAGKLAEKP